MFCRWVCVILSLFFWILYCLSFFDIRLQWFYGWLAGSVKSVTSHMLVGHVTFWSTGISGFILDGLLQLYRPTDINSHYHGYLYVLIPQVFLSFIDSLFWLDDYFNSNRWNIYGVVVNTLLKLADFVLHHTFVYIIRNKSANSESRRIGCSILCNILRCR